MICILHKKGSGIKPRNGSPVGAYWQGGGPNKLYQPRVVSIARGGGVLLMLGPGSQRVA